ncbi:MAG: bifunctional UDP-N-acetylglucosamine diphosphorylase/glucosamine-1-phosphate N-acetyltransferase GlmU [Erysipelotrichaceae bacterium]
MKSAIILAAGKGTRMKSAFNKVMHPVSNKPMISHIVTNLKKAGVSKIVVVVGYESDSVKELLQDEVSYALQEPQLGTGHAVQQACALEGLGGDTLVLNGDGPLIQPETIQAAFKANEESSMVVLTSILKDGAHYGRIVRDEQGNVVKIVEAKDCTQAELEIKEINTGLFCFKNKLLFDGLKEIKNDNAQHEYYLTDLVEIFNKHQQKVKAMIVKDADELMGVNDRVDLAKANAWLKEFVNHKHMVNGVTIVDPNNTYIDPEVEIGRDTIIYPNVHIEGNCKIGCHVEILSGSFLRNAIIDDDVVIDSSKIVESKVGKKTTIGPMSHLRNNTEIGENCRIGNFVEFKNSKFGDGSKCAHLTYIGDSDFGKHINVGCGVVTVNYDGKHKFRTTVKDGAFIGSNCNLIAPVTIGENVLLAAGSTITDSVEDGDMGIARARQTNKAGFGTKYKNK